MTPSRYPTLRKLLAGQSVYAITQERKKRHPKAQVHGVHSALSRELRALLKAKPELNTHLKAYL